MAARRHRQSVVGAGAAVLALAVAGLVGPLATASPAVPSGAPVVVAQVGETPWELALVPGSTTDAAFITQKVGDIVYVASLTGSQGSTPPVTVALPRSAIPVVRGFLGLALAPDFATSHLAYVFVDQGVDPDGSGPATGTSSIWRLRASGSTLRVVDKVFGGIPDDADHDGGRIVFGPDGDLYASTGDLHDVTAPQDVASLGGKILRLAVGAKGATKAPPDNPFVAQGGAASFVWSLGHRNPQGLVFDSAGRLWEDEHGPSGESYGPQYPGSDNQTGRDELNLIVKGGNYGWPIYSGPDSAPGYLRPKAVAGDAPAWAPGDLALGGDGSLYAPFLIGAAGTGGTQGPELHRFDIRKQRVSAQGSYLTGLGRLRVAVASGSSLLVVADGRLNPSTEAGKIYRVPLRG